MHDDEPEQAWHERPPVVVAGGIAAAVLAGMLVYAVMQVSEDSTDRPGVVFPASSSAVTSTSGRKTPTSTSYARPSVQTSQLTPTVEAPPPTEAPPGAEPTVEPSTPTTNPYATSTTSNAGAI